MADNKVTSVVMDNGSGMSKVGFAGEETPKAVFPTISGKPKHGVSLYI